MDLNELRLILYPLQQWEKKIAKMPLEEMKALGFDLKEQFIQQVAFWDDYFHDRQEGISLEREFELYKYWLKIKMFTEKQMRKELFVQYMAYLILQVKFQAHAEKKENP